jgi:hypothetical protein
MTDMDLAPAAQMRGPLISDPVGGGIQLIADQDLFGPELYSCQAFSGLMTSHAVPPSSAMEAAVT